MNPPDFERFQVSAQDHGVLFYYVGEFTAPMVSAAADTLKARLATEDASGPAKRKVFSTFVEMAQNILHYAAPSPGDGAQASPRGAIAVGRLAEGSTDGQYWLVCRHPVTVEHVARLTDKLTALRAMSLEEIKQSYREQLRNDAHTSTDTQSCGAGLGLLTMARDASAPLEFSFASTSDPHDRTALFHVKARI